MQTKPVPSRVYLRETYSLKMDFLWKNLEVLILRHVKLKLPRPEQKIVKSNLVLERRRCFVIGVW
jgi:hypothetical protein